MTLEKRLQEIEARLEEARDPNNLAVDRHAIFIAHAPSDISALLRALKLAVEQRNYELGDVSEDYTGGIQREIDNYNAALLQALSGGEGK